MPTYTLDEAVGMISRMRSARPECANCELKSYSDARDAEHAQQLFDAGWEPLADRAAFVRRCASCATSKRYPWADRLDAERVLKWINDKPNLGSYGLIDLRSLKELVEP